MTLPTSDRPLLVRTDFSNEAEWPAIRASILAVPPELQGAIGMLDFVGGDADDADDIGEPWFVEIIDERRFADMSTADVLQRLPADGSGVCLFIADHHTISDPDHLILVVDLLQGGSRTFRTVPSQVCSIGSNFPIANMDWEDFANNVDAHGVFRGH